jgi:hypothetical protein
MRFNFSFIEIEPLIKLPVILLGIIFAKILFSSWGDYCDYNGYNDWILVRFQFIDIDQCYTLIT